MKKKLIITEKPSVATDLARVLGVEQKNKTYYEGNNYIITWAYGHLLTLKLPEDINKDWQNWDLNDLPIIPKNIGIKPLPKTKQQLKAISRLAKRTDVESAIIATDSGREGEAVARYILEWIRFNKPVERLWISSQTTKAIREGFSNLRPAEQFDDLYASALARGKADWLVGLNVTRALTTKYKDNLSAGRVQTPTLSFIWKQEQEINSFRPHKFYKIYLVYQGQTADLLLKNSEQFETREQAEKVVQGLQKKSGLVEDLKVKQNMQDAPLPYDLTELQRTANSMYAFSAKKTLSIVQSLYEVHKIVSYPRTDSKYLSTDIKDTLKERLSALSGFDSQAKAYLRRGAKIVQRSVFNDQKVTDHYALIPTEESVQPAKLSSDELRIFRLIEKRFLGLFAEKFITETTNTTIGFGSAKFVFKQTRVVKPGWRFDLETETKKTKVQLKLKQQIEGQFIIKEKLTTPPKPLTEGTLLGKMEKFGLGTPATRAEIIEKLTQSELVKRTNGALITTPKGQQLLKLVNKSLASPDLTSKWEKSLESIAHGKVNYMDFVKDVEKETRRLVSEIKTSEIEYRDFGVTNKLCPECGYALKERNSRDGKILTCSHCGYRRRKDPKVSNHRCPQCHKKMVILEKNGQSYFRCLNDGTTEKMLDKKERKKKISKKEERKLLSKINNEDPEESPLAIAMKKAMEK
ncbi:DNA topoisomerase 3 [Pediococcus claussenii]|uniref:DNA topoisomerase n=1 Tax=Pediococcus claussenii (strain ATCC BAA-344 / DSM 14800 / JCM 18046 / KCTC 3811 / LMG 21948 / P06) TaxID=701521 RepID=G8PDM7_PEDCP|nr:DNA topoisomerase 3 [Pediococcus claussenii]AEV95362.1 DNA topoisomerase III family protein [Pediococcus claussenii ATCC BAA-344]ANZ68893.1 DNA topoisomerase III [Pediococcus claussenii]ANZ70709.1 DNA topoisomerase III [Pediococcus claussenii]KRN19005.1 topB protein [Pediococcus claussenii]